MHRSLDRSWKKRVETNELNPQKVETDLARKITEKKKESVGASKRAREGAQLVTLESS